MGRQPLQDENQSFGNPVCIVDDDLTKKGLRVQGVPVRGTISDIPELVRKYHIRDRHRHHDGQG